MKIFYTIILLLFLSVGIQAQNLKVYGTVSDLETGETLTGVSIQEKGALRGSTTDLDGNYELTISKAEVVLIFTYVGYKTSEVTTTGAGEYSVKLAASTTLLNEVVVTALGLERSSRDLGYAVQRIDGTDISDVKSPNFVDNLAAQVAGVTVSQGATGVGSTSKVTIRGEASFTNNNPLFVVDGIPINNNSIVN